MHISQLTTPVARRANTSGPAPEQDQPAEIREQLDLNQTAPEDKNLFYSGARALVSGVGGVIGGVAGLPFGAYRGAVSKNFQVKPEYVSAVRLAGALGVTGLGIAANVTGWAATTLGIDPVIGTAASVLLGPIVGSAVANGAVGVGEGLVAGGVGGVQGVFAGGRGGAKVGASIVDWVAGR
ncbi:MAG: hypothetical protein AB7S38_02465 [Vulcanimicrobiota bacterium]